MKKKPQSVWFCAQCMVSGEAKTKDLARMGMVMHFSSQEHQDMFAKTWKRDLRKRLAAKKRKAAEVDQLAKFQIKAAPFKGDR